MADNFWPIPINPMALGADESTLPGGAGWENANLLPIQKNRKTGQWAWGMPNSLAAALSGIMAPGKAANGLYERMIDPTTGVNYYDGMLGDVSNLAGMLTLGGSAIPKPKGSLGIFGGEMALTADKTALETAKKMAADGANRDEIWNATGWFKGKDDKWRFEIDDSASQIGKKALDELAGETGASGATQRSVAGAIWHKDLYDAYPTLRSIDVDARYNTELKSNKGSYSYPENNGGRPEIKTETNSIYGPQGTHGVLLHELEHAVQDIEGFARGASATEYARGPMFSKQANALKDDLTKSVYGGKLIPTQPSELINLLKYADPKEVAEIAKKYGFSGVEDAVAFLRQQDELRTPYSQYHRTAGEVAARNAQTRMNMTAAERRAKAPWYTQDVPDELQIVRMRGN